MPLGCEDGPGFLAAKGGTGRRDSLTTTGPQGAEEGEMGARVS